MAASLVNPQLEAVAARIGWRRNAAPDHRCAIAGYDGSAASAAALAYATGWAQRNQAALVIVHVGPAPGATWAESACTLAGVAAPHIPPRDLTDEISKQTTELERPWAYLSVYGDVAAELESIADALKADAIIVGKSERRSIIRRSVAQRLLAATHRIVIVV